MIVLVSEKNSKGLSVTVGRELNCNALDFCLTVHHQLGKVIQMNQLDATMIY